MPTATDRRALLEARLRNQRLIRPGRATAAEVVAWFGAVQAQEYAQARWGVGQRGAGLTDAAVEAAFDAGHILRTHVLRPTWHFVAPADIRWMLALTGPRVSATMAPYLRQTGLDEHTLARAQQIFTQALEGGRFLTRRELADELERHGIAARGVRLAHVVMRAELDAVICSGPRRGSQFTYALLDERAPRSAPRPREEAVAELMRRYLASHGPATLRDFAWWSGLTMKDGGIGVALLGSAVDRRELDGLTYWYTSTTPIRSARQVRSAHLVPIYDESLIAYRDRLLSQPLGPRAGATSDIFMNYVLVDGRLAGTWNRTKAGLSCRLEIGPYRRLTRDENTLLQGAVERYRRFIGCPVTLSRPSQPTRSSRPRPPRTASAD